MKLRMHEPFTTNSILRSRTWQELALPGAAGDLFGRQKRRLLRVMVESSLESMNRLCHSSFSQPPYFYPSMRVHVCVAQADEPRRVRDGGEQAVVHGVAAGPRHRPQLRLHGQLRRLCHFGHAPLLAQGVARLRGHSRRAPSGPRARTVHGRRWASSLLGRERELSFKGLWNEVLFVIS